MSQNKAKSPEPKRFSTHAIKGITEVKQKFEPEFGSKEHVEKIKYLFYKIK